MSSESRRPRALDALLVAAQLGLLALIALGPRQLGPEWPSPWSSLAIVVGAVSGVVGGMLALAGALHLGRNLTPVPRPGSDAVLIRSGAYRIVRHPIYSGLILMGLGWALFVNGALTLAYTVALFALLDFKSRHEERWLIARFDDYPDYARRVRRLVPFLY